jgi:hypothetical protein
MWYHFYVNIENIAVTISVFFNFIFVIDWAGWATKLNIPELK